MFIHLKSIPRAVKMLRFLIAITAVSLLLTLIVLSPTVSSASASTDSSNHTSSSNSTSSRNIGENGGKTLTKTASPVEQTQPTDLSSVYVQIPIAEPSDAGVSEGVQHSISSDGSDSGQSQDGSKSWTGSWPKKFQIGYIKQSDLHQVLIESLKGDSFVSIGLPGTSAATTSKTQAPSKTTTKSAESSASSGQQQQQQQQQWPPARPEQSSSYTVQKPQIPRSLPMPANMKSLYRQQHQPMIHNFRDSKLLQPATFQRFPVDHQQQQFNHLKAFNQMGIPMQQQLHNIQQQQQQFQFAGFPSNYIKNQPMYTINNFPQQEQPQLHQNSMERRPHKSAEYYTSWRPVTSDKSTDQNVIKGQYQMQDTIQSDGFDDGFTSPSKDASLSGSTNRHPMLNSYLSSNSEPASSGKTSPTSSVVGGQVKGKNQTSKPNPVKGATKSAGDSTGSGLKSPAQAVKGGSSSSNSLSGQKRRVASSSSSTTSSTTSSETPSTTAASISSDSEANSTSLASVPSTTSSSLMTTTTTTTETSADTTEPDSEVIESETTEPTSGVQSTTETSSTTSSPATNSSSQPSTSKTVGQQADNGESEVATQEAGGQQQQSVATASLPPLSGDNETTQASTARSTSSTPSTVANSREETTPANEQQPGSESAEINANGEIEGTRKRNSKSSTQKSQESMSDEALLAAAVRTASDIGKTQSLQRQRQPDSANTSSSKKTRSSERLLQSSTGSSRKSSGDSNKSGKKASSNSSARSAKQVGQGVKGATSSSSSASRATKSASLSKKTTKKPAGPKTTRMVVASERLQQQPPQIVSMSAAQAQSTAQTLASLLLSRCMSSTNCAHLLDVCTTKQAMVPLFASSEPTTDIGSNSSALAIAAWSVPMGLMSSGIMSLASSLQADRVLKVFPQWKDAIDNVIEHDLQSGYTLILPSNEAIDRLPVASIDNWLANQDQLVQLIDNHILDSAETIEFPAQQQGINRIQTRVIRSKSLQVNQHRDRMITVNGKRLVYVNQAAPANGRIHVIDGLLDWSFSSQIGNKQPLDIMDTLKQCDKFDGFVTLAEGTGLTQILKQDGPMTVFVPSNEALRKIPDEELEVIKNNSTALKEFLMYHVVNGSYFSQDLRDGQQLASILDMKPIQVGVRVDGCSRRLVEANTSPMRRADIVAKNGVIHILDWYLTVRDNEWCEPIRSSSGTTSTTGTDNLAAPTSERLQQLASSDSGTIAAYATRVSALPANHKPSSTNSLTSLPVGSLSGIADAAVELARSAGFQRVPLVADTNNIVVSATPIQQNYDGNKSN